MCQYSVKSLFGEVTGAKEDYSSDLTVTMKRCSRHCILFMLSNEFK